MNRAFATVFGIIFVISILEVTTSNFKESNEHDENMQDEAFHEFDEDSYEYPNKAAHQNDEKLENDDTIKIRQPTGVKPNTAFKTPINMPPVRFAFWYVYNIFLVL